MGTSEEILEFRDLGWSEFMCVMFRCNMGFRDSWIGRILLTQMDWLRIWFTSAIESLCWFEFSCFHHPSTVGKHTQLSGNAFVFRFSLEFHYFCCLMWFLLFIENRGFRHFLGSIFYCTSLLGKVS